MKAKKKNNSGDRKGGTYSRRQKILLLFLLLTYLLNVALLILGTQVPSTLYNKRMDGFQEGRVAPFNLVAETDTFYTDVERTERLRKVEAEKILPVYRMDEMKVLEQVERFEEFAVFFMKEGRLLNQSELFDELSSRYPDIFAREDVEYLLEGKGLFEYIPVFEDVLVDILEKGIFPEQLELNEGGGTAVIQYWHWRGNQKIHERYTRDQITTADRIDERVEKKLSALGKNEEILNFATILLKKFARQNTFYDPTITEALRKDAAEKIGPVSYEIQKGQTIVREGEVVSADDMQRIRALMDKRPRANLRESVAIVLYLFGIFFLAYIMYAPLITNKPRFFQYSYILMVSSVIFTLNIFFVLIFSLVPAELPLSLGIMTALISMLIATLMTQRIGIISSLLFSLLFVAIPGLDFYTFVFSFLSGITATYLIRNAERRIDLVTATVQLAVVVIFIIVTIGLFQQKNGGWYLYAGGFSVFHVFITGALNLALLPALEHMLNAPTVFRLRELADTNSPIFKRMVTVAPGTYSHSMSVANLAESASKEIGANHLLARVGAYYHDIGKMDQPNYFIENQQNKNKHDELTPSLSVAVIKSHVKVGIEKAKELKLPPEVVEIVSDHHGNDVIGYFYQQAVKKTEGKVTPSEFSYNGIPPRSKESAVVMLADSIEAQSRTIKKPTVQKIEKMVWDSIMYKIGKQQLSNSVLSFQEIEKIKRSFVQILAGQFHNRIEYPDQRDQR